MKSTTKKGIEDTLPTLDATTIPACTTECTVEKNSDFERLAKIFPPEDAPRSKVFGQVEKELIS